MSSFFLFFFCFLKNKPFLEGGYSLFSLSFLSCFPALSLSLPPKAHTWVPSRITLPLFPSSFLSSLSGRPFGLYEKHIMSVSSEGCGSDSNLFEVTNRGWRVWTIASPSDHLTATTSNLEFQPFSVHLSRNHCQEWNPDIRID